MSLFTVADYLEQKLKKSADSYFPNPANVFPIVQSMVERLRSNPLLKSVIEVSQPVWVENTIDNVSRVYFQLVVQADSYNQLMEEPENSQLTGFVRDNASMTLKQSFPSYDFRVKVGLVTP